MVLTTTIISRTVWGDKDVAYGKGVITGSTATGDVQTGMEIVEMFLMWVQGSTYKGCSVNETLPLSVGGAISAGAEGKVTVVTETNDQTFYWMAIGYQ